MFTASRPSRGTRVTRRQVFSDGASLIAGAAVVDRFGNVVSATEPKPETPEDVLTRVRREFAEGFDSMTWKQRLEYAAASTGKTVADILNVANLNWDEPVPDKFKKGGVQADGARAVAQVTVQVPDVAVPILPAQPDERDAARKFGDRFWALDAIFDELAAEMQLEIGARNFKLLALSQGQARVTDLLCKGFLKSDFIRAEIKTGVDKIACMRKETFGWRTDVATMLGEVDCLYEGECKRVQKCVQQQSSGGGGGQLCGGNFWKFLLIAVFIALIIFVIVGTGGGGAAVAGSIGLGLG